MKIDWEVIMALATFLMLIVLVLTVFIAGIAKAGGCMTLEVPSQAVLGNYDGDTVTLFSFSPGGTIDIRVEGVDTPERTKKEPGWDAAKLFTATWLAKGPFTLTTCGKKTLTRIVGTLERNGRTLAQDLIAAGHAKTPH